MQLARIHLVVSPATAAVHGKETPVPTVRIYASRSTLLL